MNHVEKLIAKLINEHKVTGEEAIVLIKAIHQIDQNKLLTIDDLIQAVPHKNDALDNRYPPKSITGISDGTITIAY